MLLSAQDGQPSRLELNDALPLDVDGGIDVPVMDFPAMRASPFPSRKLQLFQDMSAGRTRFGRRKPGVNGNKPFSLFLRFVLQTSDELTPGCVPNGTCQVMVLHHVLNLQTLNHDRLVVVNQLAREFVNKVSAASSHQSVNLRQNLPGFLPVGAAFLLAGQRLLRTAQFLQGPLQWFWIGFLPAVGIGGIRFESQIRPQNIIFIERLFGLRQLFVHLVKETGVVIAAAVFPQGNAFEFSFGLTVNYRFDLSNFRDTYPCVSDGNTGAVIARLFVSTALKAWVSCFVRQKLDGCSVSMTHGLLQSYAVVFSKPAVLSAFLGNGKERFDIFEDGDTLPMHLVAVLPNIDALVVAEAHRAELPAKELLLFLRRIEADFGGFEHRTYGR